MSPRPTKPTSLVHRTARTAIRAVGARIRGRRAGRPRHRRRPTAVCEWVGLETLEPRLMLCVSPHGLDDPGEAHSPSLAASPAIFAEHRVAQTEDGFDTSFGSDTLLASPGPAGELADILYIRVDFDDLAGEPVTADDAGAALAAVGDFMLDSSWGQFGFDALDITATYRMPYTADMYTGWEDGFLDLMDDAIAAALQDGYDAEEYWSFAVVFDWVPGWNWSGLAYVGAPGVWLNGAGAHASIIAHEFGHNLGAWHSGWWQVSDGEPVSPAGELVEYGDAFDVMGTPWTLFPDNQFNTYWKTQFGWMDAQTNVVAPDANGTYRLYAHDFGVGAYEADLPFAIEIPFGDDRGYWIEYRQSIYDSTDSSGIELRWAPWEESGNNTLLLDMSGTGDDPLDSPLWIGETFLDSAAEFSITPFGAGVTAAGNWWVDVELVFAEDTPPWVVELAAEDVTEAFGAYHEFAVTYADDTALDAGTIVNNHDAILVTGPDGFEASVSYVGIDDDTNGTPRTAIYRIDAPDGGWRTAHNGAYTVRVEPEQVADTSGNFVPAGPIGSFEVDVDTVPPQADLVAADVTQHMGTDHLFDVIFEDNAALDASTILENGSAILVTGPGDFERLAAFVTIDDPTDGTPRTATYRIDAPGEGWQEAHNGTYTVHVRPEQVADASGNFVSDGPIGSFEVHVEAQPPEASLDAADVIEGFAAEHVFQVLYEGDLALDAATLLGNDAAILVTGLDGFERLARFLEIDDQTNGTPRTATYALDAPGDGWQTAHNGTYTVHVQPDQVADTSGTAVPAGEIGAFEVDVDTLPPAASAAAEDVTDPFGADHAFTVGYSDNIALNAWTIVGNDGAILVTGPAGFDQLASFVAVDDATNGTPRQATYRIEAPAGGWQTEHNGTYTVHVRPGQIADTSGNFAAAAPIGSFEVDVDTTPPEASLATDDVTEPFATEHLFSVTYTDNVALDTTTILDNPAAVRVTGPGFERLASFIALDDATEGTPREATYRIDAPDGGWRTEHNGAYTVHLEPEQVADTSGNLAPGGPIGAFDVDVDTLPPEAALTSEDVTEALAIGHTFQVIYSDNAAVDAATIVENDGAIRVTGPGGFESWAAFVGVDDDSDGSPRTATYRVDAPDGGWRADHNGMYAIHVEPEQIADTSGNLLPAGQIGTFDVSVGVEATIGPDHARFLQFTDEDGTRVTLRLTGGRGVVLLGGIDLELQSHGHGLIVTGGPASLDQITLSGTDLRTLLSIAAHGGDGRATVGAITGDSPIGRIIGPRVDLIGDGIAMTGDATARLVQLHGLRDGADLVLPGELPHGAVIRLAGAGDDSRISVGAGIRLLHARQSLAGSIEAPWIGAMRVNETLAADVTVTGDDGRGVSIGTLIAGEIGDIELAAQGHIRLVRSGGWADGSLQAGSLGTLLVHGDFAASLDLTDPEQRFSLARATIRGGLTDGSWTLASDAVAIVVLGEVQNWRLEVAGDLRILRLGGADAADLHVAGRINSILALGDLVQSQLHVADHLRNLTVRGHTELDLDTTGRIDRAVILGELTGEWEAESIGRLHVRDDLRDARIELTRPPDADRPHHRALHRLQVGRWIDSTALRATGHIGAIVTGGARDATIFAGVNGAAEGLPEDRDAFDALASIHLLRVRGVAGSSFDVINSGFAAWHIRHAHLQHLQTDNAGAPFGLAAAELDRYVRREGPHLYRWPNRSDPLPPADADAVVRLV